jgi:hypothetical protein
MGRNAEAETLYEQARAITKTALGEAHPHVILFLASLAGCRACLGLIDEAEQMVARALGLAVGLDEGADLWTGRVRLRWAHGLKGAGRSKEAHDLLSGVLGPEAALTREAADLLKVLGDVR